MPAECVGGFGIAAVAVPVPEGAFLAVEECWKGTFSEWEYRFWRVAVMNEISMAGMHSVRNTNALSYSPATSASLPVPSVQSESVQVDRVNLCSDFCPGLAEADAFEPAALQSSEEGFESFSEATDVASLGQPKQEGSASEFDGFLIAGSPASKSSSQSTVAEVSVSSLGTIALIEDVPQTESEAIGAASSVIAVSDEGANAVNSLEMFLNGPSTISQGLYNMSGDRIA